MFGTVAKNCGESADLADDAGDDQRVAEGHAQHRDGQRPEADRVLRAAQPGLAVLYMLCDSGALENL